QVLALRLQRRVRLREEAPRLRAVVSAECEQGLDLASERLAGEELELPDRGGVARGPDEESERGGRSGLEHVLPRLGRRGTARFFGAAPDVAKRGGGAAGGRIELAKRLS